ncbi:D-aminoacyl-tRNA deacylase [Spirochaetia bacterium 38H-sp]|uniref:D-aminoacyl-tRNA deacylase n=1 Tax=Rarispira pelagica TaxID=3141764 RepID=A0ABU9UAN8_9SPIR
MRAVVQRVSSASVSVDGSVVSSIDFGFLVLLGVAACDNKDDAEFLADKVANLRVFSDEDGKLNRSILDIAGQVLVVSQFTLMGDARKGRRPSYNSAAPPALAEELYEYFCIVLSSYGLDVKKGVFRAHMDVRLCNDGPVTILLDSKKLF